MGSLSPSTVRAVGADTSCLTPGLELSSANGQSSPSVDSMSITGTGGKVFSSARTQCLGEGARDDDKDDEVAGKVNTLEDD